MFVAKPYEEKYELVMPVYKTVKDLREALNLPENYSLSDMNIIDYVDNMKNPDHSTLLFMRYILGYSYKRIEKEGKIYYASMSSACQTAIRSLRKEILEDLSPDNIGNKPINDIVYHKISNSLGLTGKTLYESIEWLMKFEYVASKDVDTLVHAIKKLNPDFNYPMYLLKNPPYPYNLYSYLLRGRNYKQIPVKDIHSRYMYKIAQNPNNNFYSYYNHVDEIFSERNLYMRIFIKDKDLNYVKLYFKDGHSVQEISKNLTVPETTVKAAIYRVIDLLNGEIGTEYIHCGFPIK